jgi:hypothetical protein
MSVTEKRKNYRYSKIIKMGKRKDKRGKEKDTDEIYKKKIGVENIKG